MTGKTDSPWDAALTLLREQRSDLSAIKTSLARMERMLGRVAAGVAALVSLPLRAGRAALADAANIVDESTRRQRILQAISALIEAYKLEPPLNSALAAMCTAICYELLDERAAATSWLEHAYDALEQAYLENLDRVRNAFKKRRRLHLLSFVGIGIPVLVWDGLTDWDLRHPSVLKAGEIRSAMKNLAEELERRECIFLPPDELLPDLPTLFERRDSDDDDGGGGLDRGMLYP